MARISKLRQAAAMNPEHARGPVVTDRQKAERLLASWCDGIKPPERYDLDSWADKYRFLPSETSSARGQWRTSRFQFLRRIMKCLSPTSAAKEIVAVKGAQLGFTECAINWIFFTVDQDPGPVMYTQKTVDAAHEFVNQKLEPSIRECPQIFRKIGAEKPKFLTDEVSNKGFPGGFLACGGSNSGVFLRSKSIKNAIADEEDSFKSSVDSEGSPVGMMRKRQANFPGGKFFRLSTPKISETSTIEPAWREGSQERYYIPCPHCNPHGYETGFRFWIRWEYIHWSEEYGPDGDPVAVWMECPNCGEHIEEHSKTWMYECCESYTGLGWMSEKGSPGKPYPVTDDIKYPSFHISSLYSPLGFFSWVDAIREFNEYKKTNDKALLQVFINQTLGETYSAAGQDINASWLKSRREIYPVGVLPPGILVITAGADIQEDRIECEVVGHGLQGETWSLGYRVFYGATDVIGDWERNGDHPTAWMQFDEFLRSSWMHPCGMTMGIECTLVDTGFRAEPVHIFARLWEASRVFPVRGRSGWGRGYIERPKRRTEKYKTWDFVAWVDECKDQVYENLKVDKPGAGYTHFPMADEYSDTYFSGLTAETKKTKRVSGKTVLYWDCPPGVRNEPLDCRVYAFAAFKVLATAMDERARRMAVAMSAPIGSEAVPIRPIGNSALARGTPKKTLPARQRRGSTGL